MTTDQQPQSLPLTTSFQGFRSDPVPFTTDPAVRGRCMIQAIRRYLRSRTRWGRLINRLHGVHQQLPAQMNNPHSPPESQAMLPRHLRLSADQSDPKPIDTPPWL